MTLDHHGGDTLHLRPFRDIADLILTSELLGERAQTLLASGE
jgi:hypothetical protein